MNIKSRHVLKHRSQELLANGYKEWTHAHYIGHLSKTDILNSALELVTSYMNKYPQHKTDITNGPFKARYHEHACIIIETQGHQFALIQTEQYHI